MARKKAITRAKKDSKKQKSVIDREDEDFHERQDEDEIDEFYAKKNKILLEGRNDSDSETEQQVYKLSSEDDEDSDEDSDVLDPEHVRDMMTRYVKKKEIDSDIEEQEDEVEDSQAWGRKRKDFYDNDYVVKEGQGMMSEKDKEIAQMEEEEALVIQKRLADEVDEDVFGLGDLAAPTQEEGCKTSDKLEVDISKLPRKQLLKMVAEESPELGALLEDCRCKLDELNNEVYPLIRLFKHGTLPEDCSARDYVSLRYNLLIAYTTNICFYLNLKAKRINIRNHPIVKRLGQLKKLISELDRTREMLTPQIEQILEKTKNNEPLRRRDDIGEASLEESESELSADEILPEDENEEENDSEDMETPEPKLKRKNTLSSAETEILSLYEDLSAPKVKRVKPSGSDESGGEEDEAEPPNPAEMFGDTDSENDEPVFRTDDGDEKKDDEQATNDEAETQEDGDDRRAINYQISKNKGLTPHRKKEYRNPRVRHRMKYRRANIRRKGQVRPMRNESAYYGGETTGINKQVVKSVKLK